MKEFFSSIREVVVERMSSPIFGSFAISWLAWNHQYLFILFSDLPIESRFSLARAIFYATPWNGWVHFVGLPALTSLGFLIGYPVVSLPILMYWDWTQRHINRLRNLAQGNELLSREASRKIIRDGLEERERAQEQIDKLQRELDALRHPDGGSPAEGNSLESARQRIRALEGELKRLNDQMSPQNPLARYKDDTVRGIEALLKILAELPGEDLMLESDALERLKLGPIQSRHILDKALEAQLVFRAGNNNAVHLRLNERGREYVVEKKLFPSTSGERGEEFLPLPVDDSIYFHKIIRLLDERLAGMLGGELSARLSIPEAQLRELLDELKQRKYVTEETVDSRRGEYRYRLTPQGGAIAKRLAHS